MNPGDTEQNPFTSNINPEFLKKLYETLEEIRRKLDDEIRQINLMDLTPEEKEQKIQEIGEQIRADSLAELKKYQELHKQTAQEGAAEEELQQKKKDALEKLQKSFLEAAQAAKKGIQVAVTDNAQKVLQSLADRITSEEEAGEIMTNFGEYLLGDKDVVFSTGDQKSDFEKKVEETNQSNPISTGKVIDAFAENASHYGKTEEDVRKKLGEEQRQKTLREQQIEDAFRKLDKEDKNAMDQLFVNIPKEQKEHFLRFISDSDYFIETLNKRKSDIEKNKSEDFAHEIQKIFEQIYNRPITQEELKERLEQKIQHAVTESIAMELNDLYIQIYRKIYTLGAHKPFEEVEREDFMRGIEVLKNEIERNLFRINTELKEREKVEDSRLFNLFSYGEEEYTVHEMELNGVIKAMPRLRPTPILRKIKMSDFALNLISEFNHWRERTGYSHNSRLTYSHPAHDGSFYKNLGNYAEHIKGDNLDSFMLLPDAPMIQDAFQLYEKLIEEEYARIDWTIRPNMFMNKLSEFNTRVEEEIIRYLKIKYKENIPDIRFLNAVKNAIGFFAEGLLLTEPEKNAFADPVDPRGSGMFASYGTNDASSIMAFNPLHLIMRWQGQANYNQAFFIPVSGDAGKFFGGWNHNKIYKNIQAYKDHFVKLENGVEGTTDNLFIDHILGIARTGGILKRAGWRYYYGLESHYVYGGEKGNQIDLIKTYKAMDTIGYEAIKYFLESLDSSFYNKFNLPNQAQRDELYSFIFEQYFKPFGLSGDYKNYKESLKKPAIENLKKHKKELTEENIQIEMNNIFTKRTLARVIALRFPTKFLRIDKDRFHVKDKDYQRRRWQKIYELMKKEKGFENITSDDFDQYMKHLGFFEMMLRSENSNVVSEAIQISRERKDFSLGDYNHLMKRMTAEELENLLSKWNFAQHQGEKDADGVRTLYRLLKKEYLNEDFLDNKAMEAMAKYPFTFGAEDIDMRLIAFRGTGPRMIARSIKDTALMEEQVINGLTDLPKIMHKMSIDGKHDFTPIIEHLLKAKEAFSSVHGLGDEFYEYAYKVAGIVVNYFKKDTAAKFFFGLFRLGKLNSMAAEYVGRSTGVWEFDSRDIDRFGVILESFGLLPKLPYDKSVGPRFEDRYINILGKRIKFGKKLREDFKWTSKRWRKEFGADFKSIVFDWANSIMPVFMIILIYQYLKKSLEEAEGKKK